MTATTSKLGADMTDDPIATTTVPLLHYQDLVRKAAELRAILARQPAAIDKEAVRLSDAEVSTLYYSSAHDPLSGFTAKLNAALDRAAPLDKEAEQGKILNAPDRIYLVCGDLEDIDDPVLFRNLDEVTWCEDRINETDIEYVRNGETK